MWATILGWLSAAWAKIAFVTVGAGMIALAVFKIRQGGVDAANVEVLQQGLEDAKIANKIERDITKLPPGASTIELHKNWQRD